MTDTAKDSRLNSYEMKAVITVSLPANTDPGSLLCPVSSRRLFSCAWGRTTQCSPTFQQCFMWRFMCERRVASPRTCFSHCVLSVT